MRRITLIVAVVFALLVPGSADAQMNGIVPNFDVTFGKNTVIWKENAKNFYQSAHFDVYHPLDVNDPNQKYHLEEAVNQLEGSYEWLSNKLGHHLKDRIPILLHKTHSDFETSNVYRNPFIPEGVGAYAEPVRNRMVLKLDFLPPLNKTIITHELAHIFYFAMSKQSLLRRVTNMNERPGFFVEGSTADFLANSYSPYTRDDIRKMIQRGIASNPEMFLPTWEMMKSCRCGATQECNLYIVGAMVSEFLADEFGEKAAFNFVIRGYNESVDLFKIVTEVTGGKITNTKEFDQLHMDYWAKRYALDMLTKQRPYQETGNFKGRSISPIQVPYPMFSPVISPDGRTISCFTVQENGVVIVSFPVGEEGEKPDSNVTSDKDGAKIKPDSEKEEFKVLTKNSPPKPFEYLISQGLVTWPFNGSDMDQSKDGKQIVLFARNNRDHEMVILDASNGKILREIELNLDQAFSPVFSADGQEVYFSASKDITRDIYSIDLETEDVVNLTNDLAFDTAPVVSPDGTTMVYVSFVGDFQKLFKLDMATGQKEQLTFNRFNDSSPSFSDDGKTIVYTSDEHISRGKNGKVWNLYTLDIETRVVSQWTDFFGGVFTPKFARNKSDKVYYVAYWQYDRFQGYIYPNFKLYEAVLRTPIRQYTAKDEGEAMKWTFRTNDLFQQKLDGNQIFNPQAQPKKWRYYGSDVYVGYVGGGGYVGGILSSGGFTVSNITEDQTHSFRFASYGSLFQIIDYNYINQNKRLNWGYESYYHRFPLRMMYWSPGSEYPNQEVLKVTDVKDFSIGVFGQWPVDKFNRFEGAVRLRDRTFIDEFSLIGQSIRDYTDQLNSQDLQTVGLFERSSGKSASLFTAYVRDTVIYSGNAQGPFRGNAVRVQAEVAPPIGKNFLGYTSFSANGRKYFGLTKTAGTLFAVRGDVSVSSSASGEVTIMGGPYSLRGYPYGALIGNKVAYGSAELRIPLVDGIVFPGGSAVGPIRSLLFFDIGYTKFTGEKFPGQSGKSFGTVIQFLPFNWSIAWTDMDGFSDKKVNFYLNYNW